MTWLPFVAIALLFYFMMFRPEKQKRKQMQQMLDALKKNDRVVTVGGIVATVASVQKGSDEVTIKVDEGNNTKLRVLRSSIARVIKEDDEKKETE